MRESWIIWQVTTSVRPPVIAVFGGNAVGRDVLELAASLGRLIAARGAVLLTGGDGRSHGEVKQDAIAGAREGGRWVGVVNERGGAPTCEATRSSFLLRPRMGHQRNQLEACMCDAAIVLEGGNGTVSELVASLCLGRPVLLVGETWQDERPEVRALFGSPPPSTVSTTELVDVAHRRLDVDRGPMGDYVRARVTPARLATTRWCRYADLADGVGTAHEWLEGLATAPTEGAIPALSYFDAVRSPYVDWLAGRVD